MEHARQSQDQNELFSNRTRKAARFGTVPASHEEDRGKEKGKGESSICRATKTREWEKDRGWGDPQSKAIGTG